MRKLLLTLALLLSLTIPIQAQTDKVISVSGPYVDIVRGGAWGSGQINRAFIWTPLSPDQAYCLSVRNNNPTNSHTFTFSALQTGDRTVTNYSNNTGRWTADTVEGAGLSPVAADSTTTAYVRAYAAAKIALVFSGSSAAGGSPDTVDVWLVQTKATSCGPVQTATTTTVSGRPAGTTAVGVPGAAYADLSRTLAAGTTTVDLFQDLNSGATNQRPVTLNYNSCQFELTSNAGTGTAPTLNTYVQFGGDNSVNWDDRVSFNQITTAASKQEAAISSGSLAVTAFTDGTLAAGSIRDGTFPGFIRVKYVVGGTTPQFTGVSIRITCK